MAAVEMSDLAAYCQDLLEVDHFRDYCPNGLQVAGKTRIQKLVSGVTASLALIDAALLAGADAILVHHGYFWRNEAPCLVGMKRQRIVRLLQADANLLAYHLPLDAHPVLGNNAQLAARLELQVEGRFGNSEPAIGMHGRLPQTQTASAFAQVITTQLARAPLHINAGAANIRTVAWCSGAAQDYFNNAIELGVDAFITGEVSEWCVHMARESRVHYFAAGHHATERYGVQALGEHLAQHFGIAHQFIDIANPV